ncbi:hypothetical protein ACFX2G_036368 [Malus domestica]
MYDNLDMIGFFPALSFFLPKECWIDFSSSNQGLVSGLRGGSKMGMVLRERGMAETEVMELGVGIPKIKGCCQWVLISATSMIGIAYIIQA